MKNFHTGRPNLHFTPEELEEVRVAESEWDREYARVVNAVLPFEFCIAHVGEEGWDENSVSWHDLQCRVYVLPQSVEIDFEKELKVAVGELMKESAKFERNTSSQWTRYWTSFPVWYYDYGGAVNVDLRVKEFGDRTVVLAFMYAHTSARAIITTILESIEINRVVILAVDGLFAAVSSPGTVLK